MEKISDEFHDLQVDVMEHLKLPNPYNLERAADIYGIDFLIHNADEIHGYSWIFMQVLSWMNSFY